MASTEDLVVSNTRGQYDEEGEDASDVVLAIATGFLLGLVIRTVTSLLPWRYRKYSLPFTASVLISGLAVGIVLVYGGSTDAISVGLRQLESISPVVLFAVFMPALITPSGLTLDFHQVKHTVVYSFALAIFGTMINAALITMVARYVFPYSWSWSQAWLLGAILSATDPIAVISIMESSGCDEKLTTVINGESLLNDGVAYVLFEVFLGWASGEPVIAGDVVKFVFKAALGGPALGIVFAVLVVIWFDVLDADAIAVVTVSLTAAYTLWTLSDQVLSVSAVLAVLFFSGFIGLYGKSHIGGRAQPAFSSFWTWIDWIANTLIFFLSGLVIATEISNNASDPSRYNINGKDWGMMFSLYCLLIPIRVVSISMLSPILVRGLSVKDMIVLSWAGLRGAVGLTLSLIVYNSSDIEDVQFKTLVFFFVGCSAVLTLLVQGTTTGLLLQKLGYTSVSPAKRHLQIQSAELVDELGLSCIQSAKEKAADEDFILGRADWERCKELSNIEVVDFIKHRAQKERKRKDVKGAERAFTMYENELLENLRERLLRAVQSHYDVCARQGYLTPAEISILTSSIENANDTLDVPLDDWTHLRAQLDLMCTRDDAAGWSGATRRFLSKTRNFLVHQRGPLSSMARRNPALILTFVCAHAEAQRQLQLWVELEAMEDGSDGERHGDNEESFDGILAKLHQYQPYWDAEELRNIGAMARKGQSYRAAISPHDKTASLKSSLVHHMTFNALILVDDVRKVLRVVLEESRLEIQKAEDVFAEIKAVRPAEVVAVSTELLTIDILRKQAKMLRFFMSLGLLERDEVEACLDVISDRQRGMRSLKTVP